MQQSGGGWTLAKQCWWVKVDEWYKIGGLQQQQTQRMAASACLLYSMRGMPL